MCSIPSLPTLNLVYKSISFDILLRGYIINITYLRAHIKDGGTTTTGTIYICIKSIRFDANGNTRTYILLVYFNTYIYRVYSVSVLMWPYLWLSRGVKYLIYIFNIQFLKLSTGTTTRVNLVTIRWRLFSAVIVPTSRPVLYPPPFNNPFI